MKDFITSYECNDKLYKYVFNSFSSGRKLKMGHMKKFQNSSFKMSEQEFDPLYAQFLKTKYQVQKKERRKRLASKAKTTEKSTNYQKEQSNGSSNLKNFESRKDNNGESNNSQSSCLSYHLVVKSNTIEEKNRNFETKRSKDKSPTVYRYDHYFTI
jgi:hypothetical protein